MFERRQAGETPRSIASAVGVSAATVRKWLRRHESEGVAGLSLGSGYLFEAPDDELIDTLSHPRGLLGDAAMQLRGDAQ